MTDAVAHRGPDGRGTCLLGAGNKATGLGHRRLAIIDLSDAGSQPMAVRCQRCGSATLDDLALTYNGEIYNYRELRAELVTEGHTFQSDSDSEVLLHLYAEFGPSMLDRLNGIFAFAIRDGRSNGQAPGLEPGDLFLARDHVGVKPLYYATLSDGVLFGSEIKSLILHPSVSRAIDPVAIHHTLAYLWSPAPRTALAGVKKLPPGSALVVRGGRIAREWSYYDLPYDGERNTASASVIAGELQDRLAVAVSRQLVADVPVGAFLSGGLDSSSVVAMMRQAQPDVRPRCYCIRWGDDRRFDGMPSDAPFARQVASHLDVDLREIVIDPSISNRVDEMVWMMDEPQADLAPINALLIAETARQDQMKVLLSGAGGDDIFTGYRRHRAVALDRSWDWLPAGVRQAVARGCRAMGRGAGPFDLRRSPLARRVSKALSQIDQPLDRRLASYFWWSPEELRRPLYSPAFGAQLANADTAAPLLESLARIPGETDPLQRLLYLEGKHFLPDHNLNYTDKMGMAAGVEVRVPLLDLDLIRFATRIPPALKQRGQEGKAIFKQAMERFLPRNVIYREKTGFGAPLRAWLTSELRPMVDDVLDPRNLVSRGLFDPKAVARLTELDRDGKVDGSYTVFAMMCVELWCRRFVDAPAPRVERTVVPA